jgi:hypothetical protein
MSRGIIIFSILSFIFFISFDANSKENIIYKYKKYEKFDLGELEIKGNIIAPGDLTTSNLKVKKLGIHLYERKKYDDLLSRQIKTLR